MKIFDTHCHYNLEPVFSGEKGYFSQKKILGLERLDWQYHWQKAQEQAVAASLIPGTSLHLSQRAVTIAQTDLKLYAAIAIHPSRAQNEWLTDWPSLIKLATNQQVVAIGETGLDYFELNPSQDHIKRDQIELLVAHIDLANKSNLPLIIHARDQQNKSDVYADIWKILINHYQFKRPFILHCVSGPKDYIQTALDKGAYISVAGNVTFPNATAIREIVKMVPRDRLLVETDTPFLAPQAERGKINLPWMITHTVKYLEQEFKIDPQQLWQNSIQVFNLNND